MKKQLLMIVAIIGCISANAQSKKAAPALPGWANKAIMTTGAFSSNDNYIPFNTANPTTAAHNKNGGNSNIVNSAIAATIGVTDYDVQSNASSYPRIINNGDQTLSAVWTFLPTGTTTDHRGTGYNYFDGSSWSPEPSASLEFPKRSGYCNIVVTGTGFEACFAHSSTDSCILDTYRAAKGTGAWSIDSLGLRTGSIQHNTDFWSRAVAGGANHQSIHFIANSDDKGLGAGTILYSRSFDNGATWNIVRDTIPGLGNGSYPQKMGPDAYSIATLGDTIAIVIGDLATDVAFFKSTDNGTSWTKTQITNNFTGGSYNPNGHISDINGDGIQDTVLSCGGDVNVTIDNNGLCHVFWGLMQMLDTTHAMGDSGLFYFPGTNGIAYWNETMPAPVTTANVIAQAMDWNGNGVLDVASTPQPGWAANENFWGLYRTVGLAGMPSAGSDANGNLFLAFMALDELSDTSLFFKTHHQVYLTASSDHGMTWSTPYNLITEAGITDDTLHEGAYPSIATLVDNNIYVLYLDDYAPGTYIGNTPTGSPVDAANNDPAGNINSIVVMKVPKPDVLGINETAGDPHLFTVSQNRPNPAEGYTVINVSTDRTADIKVEITTLTGQVTFSTEQKKMTAGNHLLTLNTSALAQGVYFYTVSSGGDKITKRMVVE